jgi:hypothetical protein
VNLNIDPSAVAAVGAVFSQLLVRLKEKDTIVLQ